MFSSTESETDALFVGGPLHGERRVLPGQPYHVNAPVLSESSLLAQVSESFQYAAPKIVVYRRSRSWRNPVVYLPEEYHQRGTTSISTSDQEEA